MSTETKTSYTLEHMRDLAYRAYYSISFSPEKRAQSIVSDYSQELDEDMKKIREAAGTEEAARYKENYVKHLSAWLSAKSRCLSSMITGPANFPTRRNEKANRSEEKRHDEFRTWRSKAFNSIARRAEAAKPQEQKDSERFENVRHDIMRSARIITEIDNGTNRGTSRALIVSNMVNRIKTIAANGETELVKKALQLIRDLNEQAAKPIVTAKNGIWKLEQQAEAAREIAHDRANQENEVKEFEGGKLIFNYEADRIQIEFDENPDADTRTMLKSNAYKWAPSAGVWQRQLTSNAKYCLKFLTLPGLNF